MSAFKVANIQSLRIVVKEKFYSLLLNMSPPGSSALLNYLHDTVHTQDYVNSIDDQHVCINGQHDV